MHVAMHGQRNNDNNMTFVRTSVRTAGADLNSEIKLRLL